MTTSTREPTTRAWIHDVRMAQFVLKIEKLSHIMGPRGSQDLRTPSPIMAPVRRCDLSSYNLRENEYKLAVPQPRTEFYKRSLSYSGSVLWNGLPLEVRQLTSPSIFKGKLKDINFD